MGEGSNISEARSLSGRNRHVYAAGISVKVGAHYPGRPHLLAREGRGAGDRILSAGEESAEGIVGRGSTRLKARTQEVGRSP